MTSRFKNRVVKRGKFISGGRNPAAIPSTTNTSPFDAEATTNQMIPIGF
jgi:hypothetical protein